MLQIYRTFSRITLDFGYQLWHWTAQYCVVIFPQQQTNTFPLIFISYLHILIQYLRFWFVDLVKVVVCHWVCLNFHSSKCSTTLCDIPITIFQVNWYTLYPLVRIGIFDSSTTCSSIYLSVLSQLSYWTTQSHIWINMILAKILQIILICVPTSPELST